MTSSAVRAHDGDRGVLVRGLVFAAAAAAASSALILLDAPIGAAVLAVGVAVLVTLFRTGFGLRVLVLLAPLAPLDFMPHAMMEVRGATPFNLLFVLVGLSYLVASFVRRERPFKATSLGKPVLAFALLLIVSTLRSLPRIGEIVDDVGIGTSSVGFFRDTALRGCQYMILAFLVAFDTRTREQALRFTDLLGFSVLAHGAVFIVLFFGELFRVGSTEVARHTVGEIVHLNVNKLAAMYAFPFAIGLGLFREFPKASFRRWLWLSVTTMSFFVIVFTLSRAGLVGAAMILVAYLWSRNRVVAVILPLLLGLLPLWAFNALIDRVSYQVASGDPNAILTGRLESIWRPLFPDVLDSFVFGRGRFAILLSTAYQSRRLPMGLNDPHSAYLEQLLDGGLVGLAFTLAFYALLFRFSVRLSRSAEDPIARRLARSFTVALIAFLVEGLVGLSLYPGAGNVTLWVTLGILLAFSRLDRGELSPPPAEASP